MANWWGNNADSSASPMTALIAPTASPTLTPSSCAFLQSNAALRSELGLPSPFPCKNLSYMPPRPCVRIPRICQLGPVAVSWGLATSAQRLSTLCLRSPPLLAQYSFIFVHYFGTSVQAPWFVIPPSVLILHLSNTVCFLVHKVLSSSYILFCILIVI